MKIHQAVKAVMFSFLLSFVSTAWAEDWKGTPDQAQVGFGGITGVGIVNSTVGFALLGTASKKIVQQGFINDLNNSVWIEGALGPVFLSGTTALMYSAHLRWDFNKDKEWTLYALGGVGGNYFSALNASHVEFYPRFGVGAFWKMNEMMHWRGEISHNLIVLGLTVPF